ncbi:hypothetical protein L873DRAFT_1380050 [Choiromyces venosus 120613-1]|uniref:Secreted protein n=1 Tax=Choiromyces venosus 120613-1 TaxID=1336337 RepID=A0A3N4J9I1_9PEZI|nr:hypothetical protein L873DRAFT_1380050 [Choiromyces venosus 120613-1]
MKFIGDGSFVLCRIFPILFFLGAPTKSTENCPSATTRLTVPPEVGTSECTSISYTKTRHQVNFQTWRYDTHHPNTPTLV